VCVCVFVCVCVYVSVCMYAHVCISEQLCLFYNRHLKQHLVTIARDKKLHHIPH